MSPHLYLHYTNTDNKCNGNTDSITIHVADITK